MIADSPGVPPSATAHELFRGFSYVAPILTDDKTDNLTALITNDLLSKVIGNCISCISWIWGDVDHYVPVSMNSLTDFQKFLISLNFSIKFLKNF